MAGTYSVDHTTISDGNGGSVTELNGYTLSRALTAADGEIFYRGLVSHSINTRNSANSKNSLVFVAGSNTSVASGEVIGMWVFNPYVNSSSRTINQATYGGVQIVFGTGSGNANTALYRIDGADVAGTGGWKYYIVDPANTPNGEYTNGPFSNFDNYGFAYGQTFGLRRDPLAAINGIFLGKHTIEITGGTVATAGTEGSLTANSANFTQAAQYNDWNEGTTPANGASINGGYHKFGIFDGEVLPGSFLHRGVFSIGSSTTATYFQDANKSIVISDEFATNDTFNRIEFRNSSSTIEISNTVFNFAKRQEIDDVSSTLRFGLPNCQVQVFDNPNLSLTGCSFNDMDTFIFQSNTDLVDTTLRRCGQATQNGATITNSTFEGTTSAASLIVSAANAATDFGKVTNSTFNGDGSNHAIEFDAVINDGGSDLTLVWSGNSLKDNSGTVTYTAGSTGTFSNTGADPNAAIALVYNGTNTVFIDALNGSDVPSVENTGTGNVQVRQTFSLNVTGLLGNTEVRVYDNPSLFTGGGSSTEVAGVETVAAVTQTNTGSNYIFYSLDITPNVTQIQRQGTGVDFTTIGLISGDKIRVTVRDNSDNPTLQVFDEFEVNGTVTSTVIPVVDVLSSSTNFSSVIGGTTNTKIVTIEKVNATQTFSVSSGTYDIFVYRIGSLPIITKEFEVTENSRIPISQAGDRVYKNPA